MYSRGYGRCKTEIEAEVVAREVVRTLDGDEATGLEPATSHVTGGAKAPTKVHTRTRKTSLAGFSFDIIAGGLRGLPLRVFGRPAPIQTPNAMSPIEISTL